MTTNTDAVLRKIEREAKGQARRLPIIGPEKGAVLVETIRKFGPRRILEIGTLVGYSAILMAEAVAEGTRITCVEVDPANAEKALGNFRAAGVEGRIEVRVGAALEVIPTLTGPYDLLFLDAAKEEYYKYLKAAEPRLSPKAVVVADNVGMFKDAMGDFLKEVRDSGRYRSRTYDFGFDAVEVSERL